MKSRGSIAATHIDSELGALTLKPQKRKELMMMQ